MLSKMAYSQISGTIH